MSKEKESTDLLVKILEWSNENDNRLNKQDKLLFLEVHKFLVEQYEKTIPNCNECWIKNFIIKCDHHAITKYFGSKDFHYECLNCKKQLFSYSPNGYNSIWITKEESELLGLK